MTFAKLFEIICQPHQKKFYQNIIRTTFYRLICSLFLEPGVAAYLCVTKILQSVAKKIFVSRKMVLIKPVKAVPTDNVIIWLI